MEDKQIIELYWNRSDDAREKTEEKYGWLCIYLLRHILQNEETEKIVLEASYQILWNTMPPCRPQNFKAYFCKIVRNHAMLMKEEARTDSEINLLSAELIIQDFVKGLDSQERKLFVSYYWFFSSISEVALQYKISECKAEEIINSLYEKLNQELMQKYEEPLTEWQFFSAMTELDDIYLEEAEPKVQEEEIIT